MPPLELLHQFEKGAPLSTHTSTPLCRGCVAAMLSYLTIISESYFSLLAMMHLYEASRYF